MPLPDIDTALDWRGRDVIDRNGEKIGKFEELYLDEETSRPEWAAVATGLFGRKQTLIPLSEARLEGDVLQVPFEQDQVKDAPALDPDESLSADEERQLYSHYGMEYSTSGSETVLPEGGREGAGDAGEAGEAGRPEQAAPRSGGAGQPEAGTGQPGPGTSRPEAGTGQGEQPAAGGETPSGASDQSAVPPSAAPSSPTTAAGQEAAATGTPGSDEGEGATGEGGLRVGTEVTPRERVRLKKYVVTEEVTKKVPVTREEVRVEREPVGEGEAGTDERDEQVVLSEEEPVIREPEQTPEQREER
jgi:sporulation protein YlmC with PRC-barrel domain